ncbi:hypothetical protein [Chamaesiphon sp. VAR_48_metabat_403]|nr:hypothetical protein [Chamaesiphon sp. VAR_48_metabat_403]
MKLLPRLSDPSQVRMTIDLKPHLIDTCRLVLGAHPLRSTD